MHPNREHNYCCVAGGGVINCGPPHRKTEMLASKIKAEQIKATGAKVVISPCHNCHGGLEDTVNFYKLGVKVNFISDILYKVMEKPEAD